MPQPPRIDDDIEDSGWWSVVHIATRRPVLPQVEDLDHIAMTNVISLAHERAKRQQRRPA